MKPKSSTDCPIHSIAVRTFGRLENNQRIRESIKAKKEKDAEAVFAAIADALIQIFGDFAKDRLFLHPAELYVTENDIRERDEGDNWPRSTIHVAMYNGVFVLEIWCEGVGAAGGVWVTDVAGSATTVTKTLVTRVHRWWTEQKKSHGKAETKFPKY